LDFAGLPTLVARRMMQSKDGIIARLVDSSEAARVAAAEGANLIMLQVVCVNLV